MNYKGYTIKEETNLWALKHEFKFQFFKGPEKVIGAKTLDEAAEAIDELTANDPSPDDKLKIAIQCIEACKEEFAYFHGMRKIEAAPAQAMIKLCNNALKAIQE